VWTSGARSYPEHFNEFVRWESGRFEDVVINNATNGSTAESVLETLEAKALRFHPHVVFIMLGINDAEHATRRGEGTALFENNLRSIVIALKENGVLPILQTPNFPALPEKSPRLATTRAMVAAIRKVSKEEHIPLVDHWHRWEAARNDTRRVYRWLGDQVHPNAEGHRHMMQTIRTAIYPPEVTP